MPNKGFKHTEATKKKLREIAKLRSGKNTSMYGRHHSDDTKRKMREVNIGSRNPNWKGGIIQTKDGYVCIWKPDHPRVNSLGYVGRSCLVAEEKLGRYLYPGEIPHHKNEIKNDDRPENIEVMKSKSAHTKHHRQIKKLNL